MSEPTNHMATAEALLADAATQLEEAERSYQRGNDTSAENSRRRADALIAAAHVHAVLATVPQPVEATVDVSRAVPVSPGTRVAWAPGGNLISDTEGVVVDPNSLIPSVLRYRLPKARANGRATAWVRWGNGGIAEYLVDDLQVIPA